jgi:hypothetical protein
MWNCKDRIRSGSNLAIGELEGEEISSGGADDIKGRAMKSTECEKGILENII